MTPSTHSSVDSPLTSDRLQEVALGDALNSVWARQQACVNERVELIAVAITALEEDSLDRKLRDEAKRAAHMLAGSVGMFGFLAASNVAHTLEIELADASTAEAPALSTLLWSLRDGLRGR
jgi:chemotaxis protein histidine kinase CheA